MWNTKIHKTYKMEYDMFTDIISQQWILNTLQGIVIDTVSYLTGTQNACQVNYSFSVLFLLLKPRIDPDLSKVNFSARI